MQRQREPSRTAFATRSVPPPMHMAPPVAYEIASIIEWHCRGVGVIRDAAAFATVDGFAALLSVDPLLCGLYGTAEIRGAIRASADQVSRALPAGLTIAVHRATTRPIPRTAAGGIDYSKACELYATCGAMGIREQSGTDDSDAWLELEGLTADVMRWFRQRFPRSGLRPDTSPNLDLKIDSIAWLDLILTMEHELGITLDEETRQTPLNLGEFFRRLNDRCPERDRPVLARSLETLVPSRAQLDWLDRRGWMLALAGLLLNFFNRLLMRSAFRFTIKGLENLPPAGPYILCANHLSDLDALALPAALPLSVARHLHHAAASNRLFEGRIMALLCRAVGIFPVDDRNPAGALAVAVAIVERGGTLTWFPEMWRSSNGKLQPFLRGIGVIAARTDATIVPVNIAGTYELMSRWSRFPRLGRIEVSIGPPIEREPSRPLETSQQAVSRITHCVESAFRRRLMPE